MVSPEQGCGLGQSSGLRQLPHLGIQPTSMTLAAEWSQPRKTGVGTEKTNSIRLHCSEFHTHAER